MALKHSSLSQLFSVIANKIRTYTGSSAVISADDFPDSIDSVADRAVLNFIQNRVLPNVAVSFSGPDPLPSGVLSGSNIHYLTTDKTSSDFCANCYDLVQITFAYSNINIAHGAFQNCTALQSVYLYSPIYHNIRSIESAAFWNCPMLTEFPFQGVETIGGAAFYNCGFTTITLDSTITEISSDAFNNCANLTVINVPWAEGAIANAPWGATNATINYNYAGE